MSLPLEEIKTRIDALREANPMLGLRGCRLGITHPEITKMQTRALLLASPSCAERGIDAALEIMVPLVMDPEELRLQRAVIDETAAELFAEAGRSVSYRVGTMIELPRAALVADRIAEHADFFSFGTNDLTQTASGSAATTPADSCRPIWKAEFLQTTRSRCWIAMASASSSRSGLNAAAAAKPNLSVGICGEHGGDPSSIEFFNCVGVDYVSCSPFRVPVARLAAAHAALGERSGDR